MNSNWRKAISLVLIGAFLGATIFNLLPLITSITPTPSSEPEDLQDLVEYPEAPGNTSLVDLEEEPIQRENAINHITETDDFKNVSQILTQKGYEFDLTQAVVEEVGNPGFSGFVLSCWSSNMGDNGTRAFIAAMYESVSGESMVVGGVTNLLPPDQIPGVDPYIIVNAMPYIYIQWYWYAGAPLGRVLSWSYWWYDSHSHPNWYWGCYWWWRTSYAYYFEGPGWGVYKTWYWWFWHWIYWRHWYWWSTYFGPYYH